MATFELQAPDGKTYEIDAPDQASAVAAFQKNVTAAEDPRFSQGALGAAQFLKGAPVLGAYVDQAGAAVSAVAQPLTGVGAGGETWRQRYDQNLKDEQANSQRFEKERPYLSTALNVGGGAAAMLPAAATTVGAKLLGITGPSPLSRIGFGTASGGVIGGADAAARGQDMTTGAGLGAWLGLAAPVAGRAVGAIAEKLGEYAAPMAGPIADYGRASAARLAKALQADHETGQIANVSKLGPEAMVLDAGPNILGHAEAIAQRPGPGGSRILGAVTDRGKGAEGRITADVDSALGSRRDTPAMLADMEATRSQNAKPLYDAWRATAVPPTAEIKALTPILERDGLFSAAERLMALEGKAVEQNFFTGGTRKSYPTAEAWDYVKQAIDGRIGEAQRGGNNNVARIYTGLKQRLVGAIDNHPNPDVAGVWKAARGRFAGDSALIDAVESGKEAFKRGVDPNEMRAALSGLTGPEQAAYRTGGRQNVADIMGEAVRPDSQARTALASPYARERLEIVAGPKGAGALAGRLDAETAFKESENRIRGNSATARRLEYQKLYPTDSPSASGLENSTLTGWGVRGARAIADMLMRGGADARRSAIGDDAAKMLTSSGVTRDQIIDALSNFGKHTAASTERAEGLDRLVAALIASQQTPARSIVEQRK